MKHRGAGTKTITVVCLASALVMLTEQYIQIYFPGLANMNRLAAQVISGVGFSRCGYNYYIESSGKGADHSGDIMGKRQYWAGSGHRFLLTAAYLSLW